MTTTSATTPTRPTQTQRLGLELNSRDLWRLHELDLVQAPEAMILDRLTRYTLSLRYRFGSDN